MARPHLKLQLEQPPEGAKGSSHRFTFATIQAGKLGNINVAAAYLITGKGGNEEDKKTLAEIGAYTAAGNCGRPELVSAQWTSQEEV